MPDPNSNPNPYQSSDGSSFEFFGASEWNEATRKHVAASARIGQIITLALAGGVSFYAFTILSQAVPNQAVPAAPQLISLTTLVMIVGGLFLGLTFGLLFECTDIGFWHIQPTKNGPPDVDPRVLAGCSYLLQRLVISKAILEGPAFLCVFLYSLHRHPLILIAPALLVAAMVYFLPTQGRLIDKLGRLLAI